MTTTEVTLEAACLPGPWGTVICRITIPIECRILWENDDSQFLHHLYLCADAAAPGSDVVVVDTLGIPVGSLSRDGRSPRIDPVVMS